MNNILKLKGTFTQKSHSKAFGPPALPKQTTVRVEKIEKLINDINKIKSYWQNRPKYVDGIFFSAHYKDIVAKTRRINAFFKFDSSDMNKKIVGAKFSKDKNNHIITYYVSEKAIDKTLEEANIVRQILIEDLNGEINDKDLEKIDQKVKFDNYNIKKNKFMQYIVDTNNVEKFNIEENVKEYDDGTIVSIYETEKDIKDLMKMLDIELKTENILSNNTILLDKNSLKILNKKASYLVAMETVDISQIPAEEKKINDKPKNRTIKKPNNEPIIGVIDKPFRKGVYFDEWVESYNIGITEDIIIDEDYNHGTGVTSIIVDGQNLNPLYNDGCGNFRVRHFGVASGPQFSSFKIVKAIEKIVEDNKDIKVWNLSLGSDKEIDENFISPEAAFLDELQTKYDVIFVVAGTNKPLNSTNKHMKIGAPADSLNSIVVNAVDKYNNPASYTREGEVLSFYVKPDISYFGGDRGKELDCFINICDDINIEHLAKGTSYSAPWIARKLAYLICILGFAREEAKALIIDSCVGWSNINKDAKLMGHGIVPTHINDIIKTNNDEIKFVISGISEKYDTYNFQLPVPMDKGKYPFVAKATMCYFPKCSRTQGVDYTNTEFELKLGRLKFNSKTNEYTIVGINNDVQDIEGKYTNEEEARREFRKWDNTKCIREKLNNRVRNKKMFDNPLWGISVKTKNRVDPKDGINLRFGIVITLKEIHGKNRIDEFIHQCSFHQWFVEEVDVQNKIDIYNIAEEEIEFEEKEEKI